jgi:hypothetical protein
MKTQEPRRIGPGTNAKVRGEKRATGASAHVSKTAAPRASESDGRSQVRRPGRPSVATPFRALVTSALVENPGALTTQILALARQQGYAGGKSAFYALVKRLRVSEDGRRQRH